MHRPQAFVISCWLLNAVVLLSIVDPVQNLLQSRQATRPFIIYGYEHGWSLSMRSALLYSL